MKAALLTGLRRIEVVEVPDPHPPGEGEVLLRIDRVGVCGSDVHYYQTGQIGDQVLTYPASVGHECSGTVVELGPKNAAESEETDLRVGDRVTVDPAFSCGQCDQCRAGRLNTCRKLRFMGSPGEAAGALAEYRVVPENNCVAIPDNVTLDQAALIEPLTIGMHAVAIGRMYPSARVGILGAGPIGLSVLLSAKVTGTAVTCVTDLIDQRLEVARVCGADWTGNPRYQDVVEVIGRQQPWGLDVVFECSGDPACVDQAVRLLTPGGVLVTVGIPPVERLSLDIHAMRRKELVFKNVRRQRGCIAPMLQLVVEGRVAPEALLTHHFQMGRAPEAFELVAGYQDGVIKAMIDLTEAE